MVNLSRKLGIAAFLVIFLIALYFSPFGKYLSRAGLEAAKIRLAALGPLAPLAFIGLYVIATVLCLPGSVLTLAAGGLFGPWLGTVLVVIGSNLGANLAFLIARYLGQDIVLKLVRAKLPSLKDDRKRGLPWILTLRLIPAVPFNLLNYACGLSPVRWGNYFLGSLLGMLPATIAYVFLGTAAIRLLPAGR